MRISALRWWGPVALAGLALFAVVALRATAAATPAAPGAKHVIERDSSWVVPGGVVQLHYLVEDDGVDPGLPIEGTAADDTPGATAQYHINPWRWPVSSMPVVVHLNTTLESPQPPLQPAVQNAIQQWSSVSPSTFAFVLGAPTTAGPGVCDSTHGLPMPHPDGLNTVQYTNALPTGVLGLTCSYQPDNAPSVQTEFDLELSYNFSWAGGSTIADGQYDLWSTTLHEMGHAAGMAHSCEASTKSCSTEGRAAVMYYALSSGVMKRTLTDDDKAGLLALYPPGGEPIPTPTPSPAPIPNFQRNFSVTLPNVAHQ